MLRDRAKKFIPKNLWAVLRRALIVSHQRRVAGVCEKYAGRYYACSELRTKLRTKRERISDKIIWQYWAQGYDNLPEIVDRCLKSVDEYKGCYEVIRLSDENLREYIELPQYILDKKTEMTVAHFSDILRVCLLSTYGGIWLDATVLMSAVMPSYVTGGDFFAYQRDDSEARKDYWESAYAYYFGWGRDFHVNMLSSIMAAKADTAIINALASILLAWWKEKDGVPDYFFLQILFDVLVKGRLREYNCEIRSDCPPHYLQQSMNDPGFDLMPAEAILDTVPLHKLTYK